MIKNLNPLKWFLTKKPAIQTQKLSFGYANQEVLKDLSLKIKKGGRITAIIGKSGSGKSTFLKLIAGLTTFHSGKIRILGLFRSLTKKKIGYVPQDISVIPDLSIRDNIVIAGLNLGISEEDSLRRGINILNQLQFRERIDKLPSELSGGQKVRLNIVLSLLHEPEIIVLDEPFVGLDFQNRRLLWHFLESLKKKGKSVILTSHLLAETQQHADEIVIIKKGKIFFKGNVEKLQNKLKIRSIMEIKFSVISKEKQSKIIEYCKNSGIKVLDHYEKYVMVGLSSDNQANSLVTHLKKLTDQVKILSKREPNLDEMFLVE